jgi:hypothetical protein
MAEVFMIEKVYEARTRSGQTALVVSPESVTGDWLWPICVLTTFTAAILMPSVAYARYECSTLTSTSCCAVALYGLNQSDILIKAN